MSHKVQRLFFKAELSTAEQGPSLTTLQQLMPDFTVMQPHITTGLVAVSMSGWAASSVTMQQSSCQQGCRFFGRVPWSARHTVCSVNWFCLFSICTCLVCWRKYISLYLQPSTHFCYTFCAILSFSPFSHNSVYSFFYFSFLS